LGVEKNRRGEPPNRGKRGAAKAGCEELFDEGDSGGE